MPKKSLFDILKKTFSLTTQRDKQGNKNIVPAQTNPATGNQEPLDFFKDTKKNKNNGFINAIKSIWDWWVRNNYDNAQSFMQRKNRYNDMSFAYYNNPVVSRGVELLADETVQPDSQSNYLEVFAKNKKFEKAIVDFIKNAGITQSVLRNVAFELALYGDSFLLNSLDVNSGITEFQPITPYTVTDRLEFSLSKALQLYNQKHSYFNVHIQRNQILGQLYQSYQNTDTNNISAIYKSYLFGFKIGEDLVVPPWSITHFRKFSSQSEFYPFGKPTFIHAIAPYRQLSSLMNLQAMGRIQSFPLKTFTVNTTNKMTPIEKWQAVNEARQEYSNLGVTNSGKDEFTINDEIWMPSDLLEIEVVDSGADYKFVDDIEIALNMLLTAMSIPKGYIPIADDNSWGDSGKSLTQQSKVFGRLVYVNQQAMLEGLVEAIKLHFAILGQFEGEDFQLNMPFPVIEETSDRERMKSDSIRLASDILTNLGQALGLDRGEALPPDVVKSVFGSYSFLDQEEVDKYITAYEKDKEQASEGSMFESSKRISEQFEKAKDTFLRESFFETIQEKNRHEGTLFGRHYYSSSNLDIERKKWYTELYKTGKEVNRLNEILNTDEAKLTEEDIHLVEGFISSFGDTKIDKESLEEMKKNSKKKIPIKEKLEEIKSIIR